MMERSSRTRLVTALILAVVFGAGVLLGLAADSSFSAEAAEVAPMSGDSAAADPPRRQHLYERVGANESQLSHIDSIVAEHRAKTNALDEELRAEYRTGFRKILLDTREAIKGALTSEQAAEYQRLLDEWDAQAAERKNESDKD